jgi:hypothetical protein
MQHSIDTGAFTTVSGMVGGVVKAVSAKPVMMAITFGSITNVMIYAAASAGVGYVVKKALEMKTFDTICSRKQNHRNSASFGDPN